MSKLISQIREYQTNKRYSEIAKIPFVYVQEEVYKPVPCSIGYDIEVKLHQHVVVSEQDKDKLPLIVRKVRSEVAECVFGEFRSLLSELTRAAFDCDCQETRNKIFEVVDKIHNRMFVEGI